MMDRVFDYGPGDWCLITGRAIPKTQKMVLEALLLDTQCYKVRMKVKGINAGKGVVSFLTPRCSSY